VLTVLVVAGCSTRSQPSAIAPVAAQLSVERFLQAANTRDVDSMGRLFGTADGSLMDTGSTFSCAFKKIGSWFGGTACTQRTEVEVRMDAIASVVQHEDYRIVREEPVAGRVNPTRRVIVDMTMPEGRWLVEQVPLQQLMAR